MGKWTLKRRVNDYVFKCRIGKLETKPRTWWAESNKNSFFSLSKAFVKLRQESCINNIDLVEISLKFHTLLTAWMETIKCRLQEFKNQTKDCTDTINQYSEMLFQKAIKSSDLRFPTIYSEAKLQFCYLLKHREVRIYPLQVYPMIQH